MAADQLHTHIRTITVLVNNRPVQLPSDSATGAEIKQAAGVSPDFKLYGPDGEEIRDDESVRVHNHERFIAISGQDVS